MELSGIIFPEVCDLWLVELADAGPVDVEGTPVHWEESLFLLRPGSKGDSGLGSPGSPGQGVGLHLLWRGRSLCWLQGDVLCCPARCQGWTDRMGCSPKGIKAGKGGNEALGKRTGSQA